LEAAFSAKLVAWRELRTRLAALDGQSSETRRNMEDETVLAAARETIQQQLRLLGERAAALESLRTEEQGLFTRLDELTRNREALASGECPFFRETCRNLQEGADAEARLRRAPRRCRRPWRQPGRAWKTKPPCPDCCKSDRRKMPPSRPECNSTKRPRPRSRARRRNAPCSRKRVRSRWRRSPCWSGTGYWRNRFAPVKPMGCRANWSPGSRPPAKSRNTCGPGPTRRQPPSPPAKGRSPPCGKHWTRCRGKGRRCSMNAPPWRKRSKHIGRKRKHWRRTPHRCRI
jgi:hypothetical protein